MEMVFRSYNCWLNVPREFVHLSVRKAKCVGEHLKEFKTIQAAGCIRYIVNDLIAPEIVDDGKQPAAVIFS